MGALYEDVEKFFSDLFARYGRFLARYATAFIAGSVLLSCLLGMGLLRMKVESNLEYLYTPAGSQATKDRDKLAELFPDRTSSLFTHHSQIYPGVFGMVFVTAKTPGGNILTREIIDEVMLLRDSIVDLALTTDDRDIKYPDLCAKHGPSCLIDGDDLLLILSNNTCLNPNTSFPNVYDKHGHIIVHVNASTAGHRTDGKCLTAEALYLAFNLRHDTGNQRELSKLWGKKFVNKLERYKPEHINVTFISSDSLEIEIKNHVDQDAKYFAATIIIMVIYSTFVTSGGNWVSTRVLLAPAGVITALLAILAAFGFTSMVGMAVVDICGVMPFLVLGKGMDDTFILLSGWRKTKISDDIETRMGETFRSSAISVTITSLTDLLAICIGATSPFLSVKNFCIYCGVAIFICYINQLTFFAGCMVLHAQRVQNNRHCITCLPAKTKEELEQEENYTKWKGIFCSGQPPEKAGEEDSPCERIPSSFLPRLLLKYQTKFVVTVLFVLYIVLSIMGASKIHTGIKFQNIIPRDSYLSRYIEMNNKYFDDTGPIIMFAVMEPLHYSSLGNYREIRKVFTNAKRTGYLDESVEFSWLYDFRRYLKHINATYKNEAEFVDILVKKFLPISPMYANDIVLSDKKDRIMASRFYLLSRKLDNPEEEGKMMLKMREIASNTTIDMVSYSTDFIFYEHYVLIMKNTLLAVGVAMIGMLFIALAFIPHPISIVCAMLSMMSIVIGMFGFMNFWGLPLDAITSVQIILSVGFSIDFTIHISHAFLAATGKNRNERVITAIDKVGVPILNGAISSFLGILMLAFATSYLYETFFKTMLMVIVLGLFHSLMVLPVLLSFVGPKRTNKPRMFIPISTAMRSINPEPRGPRPQPPASIPSVDRLEQDNVQDSTKAPSTEPNSIRRTPSNPTRSGHTSESDEEHIELIDLERSKHGGEKEKLLCRTTIAEEDEEGMDNFGAVGGGDAEPQPTLDEVNVIICDEKARSQSQTHCSGGVKLRRKLQTPDNIDEERTQNDSFPFPLNAPKLKSLKDTIRQKVSKSPKYIEKPLAKLRLTKLKDFKNNRSDSLEESNVPTQEKANKDRPLSQVSEPETMEQKLLTSLDKGKLVEKPSDPKSSCISTCVSSESSSPTEKYKFSTDLVITETSDDEGPVWPCSSKVKVNDDGPNYNTV